MSRETCSDPSRFVTETSLVWSESQHDSMAAIPSWALMDIYPELQRCPVYLVILNVQILLQMNERST